MKRRNLLGVIQSSLKVSPVVLLGGARQTGKTTLAQAILADYPGSRYLTLDDPDVLAEAVRHPKGLAADTGSLTVIDELQKAPELLPAIKLSVDRGRRAGRFLLTGSADIFALPRVSESLAGRMAVHALHPLSQGEMEDRQEDFITAAFRGAPACETGLEPPESDLWTRVLTGGFPEVAVSRPPDQRGSWFQDYMMTVLQREVRDIASIAGLRELPRLFQLLAARSSNLMNVAELSSGLGIPHTTLRRYLALLEATFLLQPLEPWAASLGRRLVRSPKTFLIDPGLTAHLAGDSADRLLQEPQRGGPLLEAFVVSELRRQSTWSKTPVRISFFRDQRGSEVDVLLEDRGGRLVAIEVKATSSPSGPDFDGIRRLAEAAGSRLRHGYVMCTGTEVTRLTDKLTILPVAALWREPTACGRTA